MLPSVIVQGFGDVYAALAASMYGNSVAGCSSSDGSDCRQGEYKDASL